MHPSDALDSAPLERRRSPWFSLRLSTRVSLLILAVVYLLAAMTFTLLTRAWEADDEVSHVDYVEHIVKHEGIPRIGASNGIETHQPPLYYILAATWQRLLGIPAFRPDAVPEHYANPYIQDRLVLNHDYTAAEHREAVYVHEIRLLSVALGFVTVVSTYVCARLVRMNQIVSLCSGLFVALLPRELVVTSAITNDALVIPLCSLALMCFLLAEHYRKNRRSTAQGVSTICMGLLLGSAAITKFNSLPVAVILFALTLVGVVVPRHEQELASGVTNSDHRQHAISFDFKQALYASMAVIGFFLVSGWWFLRNKHLYGQFLATNVSENYLKYLGFFHPVAWNVNYFAHELPRELWLSLWYLQPNLVLPVGVNTLLGLCALACVILAVWSLLIRPRDLTFDDRFTRLSLFAVIVGGIVAEIFIIKSVGYSDARLAYVGLPALAIVLVAGSSSLGPQDPQGISRYLPFAWPAAMLATDLFVLARFLIPLGGL